jgi:hypothetical protein
LKEQNCAVDVVAAIAEESSEELVWEGTVEADDELGEVKVLEFQALSSLSPSDEADPLDA